MSLPSSTDHGAKLAVVCKLITASCTVKSAVPIVVLAPNTVRLPVITALPVKLKLPPTFRLPLIPVPPTTVSAPIDVLVLSVPLCATRFPPTLVMPPMLTAPPMPVPPVTTSAPLVVLVDALLSRIVAVLAVILPMIRLAKPELLTVPVVVPVSVVITPSKAVSLSRQTQAALTEPYGARLLKLRLISIPMSYVGELV